MRAGHWLVAAALVVAAGDWVAVARRAKRAELVLKPLALVVLVGAAAALGAGNPAATCAFTLAALVLSLAGDVFLMLPRDLFVAGLGSFLLAHIAYVAAFNRAAPPPGATIAGVAVVLAIGVPLFLRLARGMTAGGQRSLLVPVGLYFAANGAMVVSAIATAGRADWDAGHAALAIAGALLFMASDSLIGWRRFVGPVRHGDLAVIVGYHVAQVLLVLALLG
jgi:uncharacterized membrane protein YhhN